MPSGICRWSSMPRHLRWLSPLALLLSACGNPHGVEPAHDDSAVRTLGSVLTTESALAHTSDPVTVGSTPTASTVSSAFRTIPTEIGTISYSLPKGATADPVRPPPIPDFGLAIEQWIVPNCCRLMITLQKVQPLRPDTQLVSEQEVNGIIWRTYGIGPEDGSQITAVGMKGALSVLVSTQTSSGDRSGAAASVSVVADLLQSITFTG